MLILKVMLINLKSFGNKAQKLKNFCIAWQINFSSQTWDKIQNYHVTSSEINFFTPIQYWKLKWLEDCPLNSTLKERRKTLMRLNTDDTIQHRVSQTDTSLNRSESFAVWLTRSTRNSQGTSQSSLIRSDTNGDLSKTDLSFKVQYDIW